MSKSKTNRRDFLKITGASLTGLALASVVGIPQAIAKEKSSRSKESMEQFLLNTGADDLSANLYNEVLQKVS
jgi:hypothetical protein